MYELASPCRFIWFFDPFLECKLRQRKNIWGQILPLDRRAPGPLAPTSRGAAPAAGLAPGGAVWGGEQGWGHGGSFAPRRPPQDQVPQSSAAQEGTSSAGGSHNCHQLATDLSFSLFAGLLPPHEGPSLVPEEPSVFGVKQRRNRGSDLL